MSPLAQPPRADAPLPPPPPPPYTLQSVTRSSASPMVSAAASSSLCDEQTNYKNNNVTVFSWNGDRPETTEFDFPMLEETKGTVSLRTVVTQYVGSLQSRKVTAGKLFM